MRSILFNNTATVDDASTNYANAFELPEGQIGVFDAENGGNLDLTGANATAKMIIAQGVEVGSTPVKSQILEKSKIEKVVTKTYTAPAKQVTHVGYNGVDGNIEAGAGDYLLRIVDVTNGYEPYPRVNTNYFTKNESVAPYTIASKLAEQATKNLRFFVAVDALSEVATTQLVDDAGSPANVTLQVVKGSDQAIATVTDGASVDASAGHFVRIGHATETTSPLYKIASIETASGTKQVITLDRPWGGETATGVAAGSTDTAPTDSDAAGVSLTGATPAPGNDQGIEKDLEDKVTSFRTALSEDFGDTEVRATSTPETGSGSYAQILDIEKNTQYGEGFQYRATPFKAEKPKFYADASLTYDVVTVLYRTNTTANIAKSNKYVEIVLAFKAGELASAGADLKTFFGV